MRWRTWLCSIVAVTAAWRVAADALGQAETVRFREPAWAAYRLTTTPAGSARAAESRDRLLAWPDHGAARPIQLGRRVVLQVTVPEAVPQLLAGSALKLDRVLTSNLFVLEAPNALLAAREAARLAQAPQVRVSHPVRRRPAGLHGEYARLPNDPLFPLQWHLENRLTNTAQPIGPDLNVRGAWPLARGEGVLVAVGDDGVELRHPDLANHAQHAHHFNFVSATTSGEPLAAGQAHGTAVAGLAAAEGGNGRGVAGVAPAALLASWVIFDASDGLVDEETTMDMFQYHSNVVSVQNHSWGNIDVQQLPLSALEDQGVANAVTHGRGGLGVVMVRAAGNERLSLNDGNDDGYAQDPRAIAVGAVRRNGRATSYTTPGANTLLAAPSGDQNVDTPDARTTNYAGVVTTDRLGALGYNSDTRSGDLADYAYGATAFSGTSAASPQIAGLAALVLAVNPRLTYRDLQQVLLLSSRQTDPFDPAVQTNGAGLRVSHTTGFGVPDAAQAVQLAAAWPNRAPASLASVLEVNGAPIPDDGLRVVVTGTGLPAGLGAIPAFPTDGPHPDAPTESLPLVDVGQALGPIAKDLTGKAALIQRGINYFAAKVGYAVAAGARFAVVYNNVNGNERMFINGADFQFLPIPTVFISQNDGEALRAYLPQHPEARAQLRLEAARFALAVTNTLLCEHVALRFQGTHARRADVRITLVSPAGTRSVLHHFNNDLNSPLGEWTFYSTQHCFESSAGTWLVEVSDERPLQTGRVDALTLTITGTPIADADHDGLDDDWELAHFGTLAFGPQDDNDQDGVNNLREQLLGTDPLAPDVPFRLDLSPWDPRLARLSWPSTTNLSYAVQAGADPAQPLSLTTNLPGRFPETEWFTAYTNRARQFFRVTARPAPR